MPQWCKVCLFFSQKLWPYNIMTGFFFFWSLNIYMCIPMSVNVVYLCCIFSTAVWYAVRITFSAARKHVSLFFWYKERQKRKGSYQSLTANIIELWSLIQWKKYDCTLFHSLIKTSWTMAGSKIVFRLTTKSLSIHVFWFPPITPLWLTSLNTLCYLSTLLPEKQKYLS